MSSPCAETSYGREICSPLKNLLSPEISAGATVPPNRRVASQDPIIRFCKNTRVSLGALPLKLHICTWGRQVGFGVITLWTSGPSRPRLLAPKVTHGQLRTGGPLTIDTLGKTSAGDDCVAAVPTKPESRSEGSRRKGHTQQGSCPAILGAPLRRESLRA